MHVPGSQAWQYRPEEECARFGCANAAWRSFNPFAFRRSSIQNSRRRAQALQQWLGKPQLDERLALILINLCRSSKISPHLASYSTWRFGNFESQKMEIVRTSIIPMLYRILGATPPSWKPSMYFERCRFVQPSSKHRWLVHCRSRRSVWPHDKTLSTRVLKLFPCHDWTHQSYTSKKMSDIYGIPQLALTDIHRRENAIFLHRFRDRKQSLWTQAIQFRLLSWI